VHTGQGWAIAFLAVSFVEGVILVATPALIRDFSPQVGRATAMGFWAMGPVLGSLVVSAVASLTLPVYNSWQSQYVICGAIGLVMFLVALFGLRELSPRLRSQLIVSARDRRCWRPRQGAGPRGLAASPVAAGTALRRGHLGVRGVGDAVDLLHRGGVLHHLRRHPVRLQPRAGQRTG